MLCHLDRHASHGVIQLDSEEGGSSKLVLSTFQALPVEIKQDTSQFFFFIHPCYKVRKLFRGEPYNTQEETIRFLRTRMSVFAALTAMAGGGDG